MSSVMKEIREQNVQSLKNTIIQLKSALLEYRFKASQGSLSATHLVKETRRTIARLFTVLSEKNETLTNKDWKNFIELHKVEQEKAKKLDLEQKAKEVEVASDVPADTQLEAAANEFAKSKSPSKKAATTKTKDSAKAVDKKEASTEGVEVVEQEASKATDAEEETKKTAKTKTEDIAKSDEAINQ